MAALVARSCPCASSVLHLDDGVAQDARVLLQRIAHDVDDLGALRGREAVGGSGAQSGQQKGEAEEQGRAHDDLL